MSYILGRHAAARAAVGFGMHSRTDTGELLTYSGDGHLMTFAPTGTGKTSGPVICNALRHTGQLIALDVKGEIYSATADARRRMGQKVHVLDFRDGANSDSLNPLDLLLLSGTDAAAMGRSFAAEMIERGTEELDRFWSDWAESMITAGIAWMLDDCKPELCHISTLFDLLSSNDPVYDIACKLDNGTIRNRAAKAVFSSFLQLSGENTRSSVLGTTVTHLRLFDSDLARNLTDKTTINLDALVAGEPMSLYIIVPPVRIKAYAPLLRLWLSGLVLAMTLRRQTPKTRTLMLVDEAGNLGKIDTFLTAATLMRSFGLTLWSFWQNSNQLSLYGAQANTLVDNAGVIQIFGARNLRMAQDLANLIGGISAEEILRMPTDQQVLLIETKLIRAKQVRHYDDPEFAKRAASVAAMR